MSFSDYDVVVAGAGPAGSAAAITLARAGVNVLLVDRERRPTLPVGESLPPVATTILSELGVIERLGSLLEPSFGTQSAWGSDRVTDVDFIFDARGCGWRLDRARFDAALRELARDAGAELMSVDVRADMRTDMCAVERARFVVDATGRAARVARARGATRQSEGNLVAFAALFAAECRAGEGDEDSRVLVESVRDGWWYTARLPNGNRLTVFLTDAPGTAARRAMQPAGFDAMLERSVHVAARLRETGYMRATAPQSFPANSAVLTTVAGPDWIAVGDAAASFDPLSSQGIYTALYTGVTGAHAILSRIDGDETSLAGYDQRVREIFDAYRVRLAEYYGMEERWRDAPFWASRQSCS